jgi:hypothetical protein
MTISMHPRHHGGYFDYNLFFDGAAESPVPVENVVAAALKVPTGRMAVCDQGAWSFERDRHVWEVPAGEYPVDLATYRHRAAMVRVRFSEERAVRWVAALGTDARGVPLTIGVDAGMLAFVDASAAPVLGRRWATDGEKFVPDTDALHAALTANGGDWATWWFEPDASQSLLAVRAGMGGGAYPAFWGETAEGRRVAFVVDFRTVYQDEAVGGEDFSGCSMPGADLQAALFEHARFVGTDLTGANLA